MDLDFGVAQKPRALLLKETCCPIIDFILYYIGTSVHFLIPVENTNIE